MDFFHPGSRDQKSTGSGSETLFPSLLFSICRNHAVPFSKMLTFYKSEAFSVTAQYAADVPIPDKKIGVFDISKIYHSFL
jgi:hypothetical protein